MSRFVPVQTTDYIAVTTSIYADNVCIWLESRNTPELIDAVEYENDKLGTYLTSVGLKLSVQESPFVCFRAPCAPHMRVVHRINAYILREPSSHKFLGHSLDTRYNEI